MIAFALGRRPAAVPEEISIATGQSQLGVLDAEDGPVLLSLAFTVNLPRRCQDLFNSKHNAAR